MYPKKDLARVRQMASEAMAWATSDELELRRKRWRDANSRRKPDRAPVWCGMAGVSRELFPPETLECTDPDCRGVEDTLRRLLYKCWVGDDEVFDPWYGVSSVWKCSTEYPFGLPTRVSIGTTEKGGFKYHHPVENLEDFEKISIPSYTFDEEATQIRLTRIQEILRDSMPAQVACAPPLAANHSSYLEQLRAMDKMHEDLAFRPEVVHRCMAKITEAVFAAMRAAEQSGKLTPNNTGPMRCSDPLGDTEDGAYKLKNLWGDAASQEFQLVSPEMQEEFLMNYQIPCLQQFGAVQYGCCEDLTHKIDIVKAIPNLRIFVCSYWTDLEKLLKSCGNRYTIMWRQLSAHVMLPDDLDPVKSALEVGMRKLQGTAYQVILREVETLNGHPNRLKEWAELAIAAAEKFA